MADVVKAPAGGAFGEWRTANFAEIQEKAAAKPGGVGRGGVAKVASEMWKQMSESEQAPWQKKFQEHAAAFAAYKSSDAYVKVPGAAALRTQKRKLKEDPKRVAKLAKKNDPNRPKRPAGGAFGCFLARNRSVFQKECAGKPAMAVTKLASEKWKVLSALDKKPFEEEFHAKQKEFQEAMKSYVPPAGAAPEADDEDEKGEEDEKEEEDEDEEEEEEESAASPPAKKAKTSGKAEAKTSGNADASLESVLVQAHKAGLKLKLTTLLARPEIAATGLDAKKVLAALEKAEGKVPAAKKALLGA